MDSIHLFSNNFNSNIVENIIKKLIDNQEISMEEQIILVSKLNDSYIHSELLLFIKNIECNHDIKKNLSLLE